MVRDREPAQCAILTNLAHFSPNEFGTGNYFLNTYPIETSHSAFDSPGLGLQNAVLLFHYSQMGRDREPAPSAILTSPANFSPNEFGSWIIFLNTYLLGINDGAFDSPSPWLQNAVSVSR